MPLHLVTGPANSAKAGIVIQRLFEAGSDGALLVVPTPQEAEIFRREFALRNRVFGRQVGVFKQLIEEISVGCNLKTGLVTQQHKRLLLQQAVEEAKLTQLAAIAQQPGFTVTLEHTLAELLRACVRPQQLQQTLDRADRQFGRAASELTTLFRIYVDKLDNLQLVDDELYALRALEAYAKKPCKLGYKRIALYGFDELSGIQLEAVKLLAAQPDIELTLSLNYEPGKAATRGRISKQEELLAFASEHLQCQASSDHYHGSAKTQLSGVERNLFEPSEALIPVNGSVQTLRAEGVRAEIELIAAEVLGKLKEGVKAEDIAVVYRSPKRYSQQIRAIFNRYQIPHTLTTEFGVNQTAIGRAFIAILSCVVPTEESQAQQFVNYLRATAKGSSQSQSVDRYEKALKGGSITQLKQARDRWQQATPQLDRISASLSGWEQLIACLRLELKQLLINQNSAFGAALPSGFELEYAAYQRLEATLKELEELPPLAAGTAQREFDAVANLLALRGLAERLRFELTSTGTQGCVSVCSPRDLRARRFDAVIVAGLVQGEFPSNGGNNSLIKDALRQEIKDHCGAALPLQSELEAAERYRFYLSVSRAKSSLTLSYRTADDDGKPQQPSEFIDAVTRLFERPLKCKERTLADLTWPLEDAPDHYQRRLGIVAAQGDSAQQEGDQIPPLPMLSQQVQERVFSARELESFARCPMRWLIDYQLKPEDLEPDLEVMISGSIAHKVLEKTLLSLGSEGSPGVVVSDNLQQAKSAASAHLKAELKQLRSQSKDPASEANYYRLEFDLHRLLSYEALTNSLLPFVPNLLEWSFGTDKDSYPPLQLTGTDIKVKGRVDRIDSSRGHSQALLVDYKSSVSGSYTAAKWQQAQQLQIGLYMLAVKQLLKLEPVGGIYRVLKAFDHRPRGAVLKDAITEQAAGALYKGDLLEEEHFTELLAEIEQQAIAAAQQIRNGQLQRRPQSCTPNGGCAYPEICGRESS